MSKLEFILMWSATFARWVLLVGSSWFCGILVKHFYLTSGITADSVVSMIVLGVIGAWLLWRGAVYLVMCFNIDFWRAEMRRKVPQETIDQIRNDGFDW